MANVTIGDLTENTSPAGEDLVETEDDPSGTPASRKVTVENLVAATLQDYIFHNLIKNNPGQIVTDGSEPQWWDDSTNATLTDEDASGEACSDKFERVFKCVTTGNDEYGYQTFTFSDEELLDAGVTEVSLGVWVWCSAASTASVGIYGSNLTLQESDQHTGGSGWEYLTVEGVTLNASDTSIQVRLICDTGTAFFAGMNLHPGPKALHLKPRGMKFVPTARTEQVGLTGTSDVAWTDTDCTTNTDPLAVLIEFMLQIFETANSLSYGAVKHDDAFAADVTMVSQYAQGDNLNARTTGVVMCNDQQVVRYHVGEGDADADVSFHLYVIGYWMWE